MKRRVVVLIAAGLSLATMPAASEQFAMKRPQSRVFIEVYGPDSRDAVATDWAATFVFTGAAGDPCSATAIGDRAVLTAAHCVSSPAGTIQVSGKPIHVTCQMHPDYGKKHGTDFALCIAVAQLATPAGGFETLGTDAAATPVGARIKLLGFGCRAPSGDESFGRLSEGNATILEVSNSVIEAGAGASICFGDSGAAAYVSSGNYKANRRVVAVNSANRDDHSLLAMIASQQFLDWAKQWANDQKVVICGLHASATNCHK